MLKCNHVIRCNHTVIRFLITPYLSLLQRLAIKFLLCNQILGKKFELGENSITIRGDDFTEMDI